jgi:hypothetical protein
MSDAVKDVLRATAHLVNTGERSMTDAQLKGFISLAHRSANLKLAERGVRNLRMEVDLSLPPGTTSITTATTPALPAGFLAPIRMWEQITGETAWRMVRQVPDHLPFGATQTDRLGLWCWRAQALYFPGSTVAETLRIHYVGRLTDVSMPSDTIGLPDMINPLSLLAASLALGGNQFYEQKGMDDLLSIANIDVHSKQSEPFRRKRLRRSLRLGR